MRALFLVVALCACGDNLKPQRDDGGIGSDAIADAPIDTPPQATGHCIPRTGVLGELNAPAGALPCEMLPPGFVAEVP